MFAPSFLVLTTLLCLNTARCCETLACLSPRDSVSSLTVFSPSRRALRISILAVLPRVLQISACSSEIRSDNSNQYSYICIKIKKAFVPTTTSRPKPLNLRALIALTSDSRIDGCSIYQVSYFSFSACSSNAWIDDALRGYKDWMDVLTGVVRQLTAGHLSSAKRSRLSSFLLSIVESTFTLNTTSSTTGLSAIPKVFE